MEFSNSFKDNEEEFEDASSEFEYDESLEEENIDQKQKIINNIIYNPQEQWDADSGALEAVKLFFANDFTQAEKLFSKCADVNPLYALGESALTVAKAFMTFNDSDALAAMQSVRRADSVASTQLTHLGYNESFFSVATAVSAVKTVASASASAIKFVSRGFFSVSLSKTPKPEDSGELGIPAPALRAIVYRAEATLLSAVMQLFQENISSLVRAGLRFRRSYKALQSAWSHVNRLLPVAADSADDKNDAQATAQLLLQTDLAALRSKVDGHTLGAVLFTVGSQNLFLSILPRKILVLVQFLGFQGNRHLGLALLEKCTHSDDIHTGLSLLVLAAYYGLFSSFAPIFLRPSQLEQAQRVAGRASELYPTSALHAFVGARIKRLSGNLSGCIDELEAMVRSTESSPESSGRTAVQHLCFYELGISYAFGCKWSSSRSYIQRLLGENYWSSAFCHYFVGACYAIEGNSAKAREMFELAPTQVTRKYGGKVISVEQFVLKKCAQFASDNYETLDLAAPIIELLYIWNCFPSMPKESLQFIVQLTTDLCVKYDVPGANDARAAQVAVKRAIRAQALRELMCQSIPFYSSMPPLAHGAEYEAISKEQLGAITDDMDFVFSQASLFKSFETWLPPFVHYDQAALSYTLSRQVQRNESVDSYVASLEAVLSQLETSKKYSNYIFEFRLETRIHLAKLKVTEQLESLKR